MWLGGCLQGGILSPLLWSLDVDKFVGLIENEFYTLGYADNIAILIMENSQTLSQSFSRRL
jgi:hypothetical protein